MTFTFETIGTIQSCFKEKFGIPRQPGLVTSSTAILKLTDHAFFQQALDQIDRFSHLWVIFVFHQTHPQGEKSKDSKNWKPSIRPPRLGGAKRVGVLASRSPHRPNPIGLSVVKLERVDLQAPGGPELHVSGIDFLDGTPLLDIKPYLPYADIVNDATSGWARDPIHRWPVEIIDTALAALDRLLPKVIEEYPAVEIAHLKQLITELLELDPRPAFQQRRMPPDEDQAQGTRYGFALYNLDVKWEIRDGRFVVYDVEMLNPLAHSFMTDID